MYSFSAKFPLCVFLDSVILPSWSGEIVTQYKHCPLQMSIELIVLCVIIAMARVLVEE